MRSGPAADIREAIPRTATAVARPGDLDSVGSFAKGAPASAIIRRFATAVAAAAIVGVAAACTDRESPLDPGGCEADLTSGVSAYELDGLEVHAVLPTSTSSCIVANADSHFVAVDPTVAASGRLFVFLPGSAARARNYRKIAFAAARAGYPSIVLTYVNDLPVGVRCAFAASICYEEVRREIISGTDVSSRLTVGRDDAIEGRLVHLLTAMESLDPAGGWGAFHDGGSPRWDRISVAGHSQGGGHSLFIARETTVFRATAYSSGGDLEPLSATPVEWLDGSFATPTDRIGGFISEEDEAVSPTGAIAAWTRIGLDSYGDPVSVDGSAPPWGGARMLTTRAQPRNASAVFTPHHSVTVVDGLTPLDADGEPTFAPVWSALSFPAN